LPRDANQGVGSSVDLAVAGEQAHFREELVLTHSESFPDPRSLQWLESKLIPPEQRTETIRERDAKAAFGVE
jgi:hypothetical protein